MEQNCVTWNKIAIHYFSNGETVAIDESLVAGKVCNSILFK